MISHTAIADRSPTVQVTITHRVDEVQCEQTVRAWRWPARSGSLRPSLDFSRAGAGADH